MSPDPNLDYGGVLTISPKRKKGGGSTRPEEATFRNFTNPRAAADRLRTATSSLTDPHDVIVVRQYIHELETLARHQEAEGARQEDPEGASARYAQFGYVHDDAEAEMSGQILPLMRTHLQGSLQKVTAPEERPGRWVLRLDIDDAR